MGTFGSECSSHISAGVKSREAPVQSAWVKKCFVTGCTWVGGRFSGSRAQALFLLWEHKWLPYCQFIRLCKKVLHQVIKLLKHSEVLIIYVGNIGCRNNGLKCNQITFYYLQVNYYIVMGWDSGTHLPALA